MELDTELGELVEQRQDRNLGTTEEFLAGGLIGRLDAHVERREPVAADAIQVSGAEVGESHVVAVEERVPVVVVLDLQAPAELAIGWCLVDEAEGAEVRALLDRRIFQDEPVELAVVSFQSNLIRLGFGFGSPAHRQREGGRVGQHEDVEAVADGFAVHGEDDIAGAELGAGRGRLRDDALDPHPDGAGGLRSPDARRIGLEWPRSRFGNRSLLAVFSRRARRERRAGRSWRGGFSRA